MNKLKWIGLLNINEDIKRELENLKIFIGGDVRYGYGLMKIIKIENTNEELKEMFNIYEDEDFEIKKESLITKHLLKMK